MPGCIRYDQTHEKSPHDRRSRPFYNPEGDSTAEQYALELLHHDVVHRLLTYEVYVFGLRILAEIAKHVIRFTVRLTTIRRLKTSAEQVPRPGTTKDDDDLVAVSSSDDMRPCEVSTVDLLPCLAEYKFYQELVAPYFALGRFKTALTRRIRQDPTNSPFNEEEIESGKFDKELIPDSRYLPLEARKTDDRYATYWYTKMSNDAESRSPQTTPHGLDQVQMPRFAAAERKTDERKMHNLCDFSNLVDFSRTHCWDFISTCKSHHL